jgi:haloacetate dehalogenase
MGDRGHHWFFMIQPAPMPERLMSADPDFFIEKKLAKTDQGLSFFGKEALEEYKRCFRNPETVRGMCEDYRACASVDLAMDTADRTAGKRITCPVQLLWGATGAVGRLHQPAAIWKDYGGGARREALPCGHSLRGSARGNLSGDARILCSENVIPIQFSAYDL